MHILLNLGISDPSLRTNQVTVHLSELKIINYESYLFIEFDKSLVDGHKVSL
jgi:hypothetical protein